MILHEFLKAAAGRFKPKLITKRKMEQTQDMDTTEERLHLEKEAKEYVSAANYEECQLTSQEKVIAESTTFNWCPEGPSLDYRPPSDASLHLSAYLHMRADHFRVIKKLKSL